MARAIKAADVAGASPASHESVIMRDTAQCWYDKCFYPGAYNRWMRDSCKTGGDADVLFELLVDYWADRPDDFTWAVAPAGRTHTIQRIMWPVVFAKPMDIEWGFYDACKRGNALLADWLADTRGITADTPRLLLGYPHGNEPDTRLVEIALRDACTGKQLAMVQMLVERFGVTIDKVRLRAEEYDAPNIAAWVESLLRKP